MYGKKGCRPVICIYGQDSPSTTSNRSSKLLFASANTKKHARYYIPEECELVKIYIDHCCIQGDVVLECVHLDDGNEEMMFRVMFHTTFVRANILMLSRDEVDVMWDAKDLIPANFWGELLFLDVDTLASNITTSPRHPKQNTVSRYGSPSSRPSSPSTYAVPYSSPPPQPPSPLPMYASPSPPPLPPPPPPRHGTPSSTSPPPPPRYGAPSPPPPPPLPSASFNVSELETLFSAIVPKKNSSKGGVRRKPTGSKIEVHMVVFPDADSLHESQKFWDEFWKKVDATVIEEKPSRFR